MTHASGEERGSFCTSLSPPEKVNGREVDTVTPVLPVPCVLGL